MDLKTVLGFTLVMGSFCSNGAAQPAASPPEVLAAKLREQENRPISVIPLHGGVYWVSGGVSNTGFVVGAKGVVAIDPQRFASVARRELAEIAKITSNPVNVMILTHSDPDHVNGLPGWPSGMEIIAHENCRTEILAALKDANPFDHPPPPEVRDYLPTRTLRFTEDFVRDGVRFRLIHVAPAHTDGDLVIYLPDQKIVFTGDLVTPVGGIFYPILHLADSSPSPGVLNKHGSSLGWIKFMKAILALDANNYVSGHGEMLSRAELQKRVEATESRRAQIKAMFDKGMSLDEIKTALHEPAPAADAPPFPSFTETTYQELTYQ